MSRVAGRLGFEVMSNFWTGREDEKAGERLAMCPRVALVLCEAGMTFMCLGHIRQGLDGRPGKAGEM